MVRSLQRVIVVIAAGLLLSTAWSALGSAAALPGTGTTSPSPTTTTTSSAPTPAASPEPPEWAGIERWNSADGPVRFQGPSLTDLDDLTSHRARFILDRSWSLTGGVFRAVATVQPPERISGLVWNLDGVVLSSGASSSDFGDVVVGERDVLFRLRTPGLHTLGLAASWTTEFGPVQDQVASKIFTEDPAIALIPDYDVRSTLTPTVSLQLPDAPVHPRAVSPLMQLTFPQRPVVLLISDFLLPTDPPPLALPLENVDDALASLVPLGADPASGFGTPLAAGATQFGHPLTHLGDTLARTLTSAAHANVVFVNAIDPVTGSLDRASIRNALLWAEHSGQVDAVLWGLPSAAYLPAVQANALRPHLALEQTPLYPVSAEMPLEPRLLNWRDSKALPAEGESLLEFLWKSAYLKAHLHPQSAQERLGDVLFANRSSFSPHLHPIIEAFRNDQAFDHFLQDTVLRLGLKGIAFVVPSEHCGSLPTSRHMSLLGVNQLVGAVTVADGTRTAPAAKACKGPDRTAAAHGSGVDFFADARPFAFDSLLVSAVGVPFAANSMGAALKVATAFARYHYYLDAPKAHWVASDLAGMLATRTRNNTAVSPWMGGSGFLDVDNLTIALPAEFVRSREVVFSPYDPMRGQALAVLETVVTDPLKVAQWEQAPQDWEARGVPSYRFLLKQNGKTEARTLTAGERAKFRVEVASSHFERVGDYGVASLALRFYPTDADGAALTNTSTWRDWILPGQYTGWTWISTPSNGILQVPLNLGVGTILDVHRFLAPSTPVSDTAVCLALPFKLVGDITGLRSLAHELDNLNVCIYWTNTDAGGTARFYTPLPLVYDLISFFSGPFEERTRSVELLDGSTVGVGARTSGPPYYPQIHVTISVPAPVNVTGLGPGVDATSEGFVAAVTGIEDGFRPAAVSGNLPYPLAFVPLNLTFPTAISINWRYRDNIEAHHILPVPSILSPEFLESLRFLPNPIRDALAAAAGGGDIGEGLIRSAQEHLNPLFGASQDAVKRALPLRNQSTYLDALLAQPLPNALPLGLQAEPGTCQWGYGNQESPSLLGLVDDLYDESARSGADLDALLSRFGTQRDRETWPDSVIMRVQPTLSSLLGLASGLPLCTAVYPFNIPQPNYESSFVHEFDLHLENSLLIVCLTVVELECYILVPNAAGDGTFVVPVDESLADDPAALLGPLGDRTLTDLIELTTPQNITQAANKTVGEARGRIAGVANTTLPESLELTSDGHVVLTFNQPSYEKDQGVLFYVALPLDVGATGYLDPVIGVLERAGVTPGLIPRINLTVDSELGNVSALGQLDDLVRNSMEDLLTSQAYIEISRPAFFFDTWWWDDSFFDARISETHLLPRSDGTTAETAEGAWNLAEDFWWLTFPNINHAYFERGVEYWDPVTLQPDLARLRADGYPWRQPEFFEVVMQVWDDEHVQDMQMNQIHTHDASTAHDHVNVARHCTEEPRADRDPLTGQTCLEGLLAYEEGDRWFMHQDPWGNGVFDPNMGLVNVMLDDLGVVDGVFGAVDGVWQTVWNEQVGVPLLSEEPRPLAEVVETQLGLDMRDLHWWKRDGGPTANRRVYSDLAVNSSFLLGRHHKPCEEIWELPGQVAAFTDQHPRWKADCPWVGGQNSKKVDLDPARPRLSSGTAHGWHRAAATPPVSPTPAPGTGEMWWRHRGVLCEAERWETWPQGADPAAREQAIRDHYAGRGVSLGRVLAIQDGHPWQAACGNYDGWEYWIAADPTFDGPEDVRRTAYAEVLHPDYYPGTFQADFRDWQRCRSGESVQGWSCDAEAPMDQIWQELVHRVPPSEASFIDPLTDQPVELSLNGLELTLLFFGMNHNRSVEYTYNGVTYPLPLFGNNKMPGEARGGDHDEMVVTVPVPSDPLDRFPGPTEWDAFYENVIFREIDANLSRARPQTTNFSVVHDVIKAHAPLVRAWLEGDGAAVSAWFATHGGQAPDWSGRTGPNPFWSDVSDQLIPFQELARKRASSDPDEPALRGPGGERLAGSACDGTFWATQCHDREVVYDVGDLSVFGRAGFWGRYVLPKQAFIPQGSAYARHNDQHLVPDGTGGTRSTRDTVAGIDRGTCWFDPIDAHGGSLTSAHEEGRPFYVTYYDSPTNAGLYHHHEPRSGGYSEPVPSVRYGNWCRDDEGNLEPARSDREYVKLRLPSGMMGGDRNLEMRPHVTPYVPEAGFDAGVVALKVGGDRVSSLVLGTLHDVLGLTDGLAGAPLGLFGTGLNTLRNATTDAPLVSLETPEGTPLVPGSLSWDVGSLASALPPLDDVTGVLGGSPVVPLARLAIAPELTAAELVLVHSYSFVPGTQGILVVHDGSGGWSLLPARGAPGFMGTSVDPLLENARANHLAFVDLTPFRGQEVLVGVRVLGADWALADWDIGRLTVLPALPPSSAGPVSTWTGPTEGFTRLTEADAQTLADLPAGAKVILAAPLVVPAGRSFTWDDITLVVDDCGGDPCPIVVDGSLTLERAVVAPLEDLTPGDSGLNDGVHLIVHGRLEAREVEFRGLLGGLQVLGGDVALERCWMVRTGHVGVLSILGHVSVTECVFADQTLGVYTLGSQVRLQGNLFHRMVRNAGVFDESWGVVRDNAVVHSKQAAFQAKGPLGGSNLAFFGNWIEETGMGIGATLLLEDRLLGLDPRALSVPPEARTRIQDNWFEWNTLQAIEAGALSAPVIYGNNATHNAVGLRVGWLAPARAHQNTLYSDRFAWMDPRDRGAYPEDGNTWAGVWQLTGLTLPVDARNNHWGPGALDVGTPWPVDAVVADAHLDLGDPIGPWPSAPLRVALTAPGYGGGAVPVLARTVAGVEEVLGEEDALTRLVSTVGDAADSIVEPALVRFVPLDWANVSRWEHRPVTVAWDVLPGIEAIQVSGTFYDFPQLPTLEELDSAEEVLARLGSLPVTDPERALNPSVTRIETMEIPVTASHGSFRFEFAGLSESRALWRVEAYKPLGGSWVSADEVSTKSAVVHNSLVAPLLPELAFLVNDLRMDVLDPLWNEAEEKVAAALLDLDPTRLAANQLRLLADGTLAVDGVPSVLALTRDQDPVWAYEYRYELSSEPGVVRSLGNGLGASGDLPLPPLPEGVTLTLLGRAVDASGAASPFVGARILRDGTQPTLRLDPGDDCIASSQEGVHWVAHDPAPAGSVPGTRASGLGLVKLRADGVDSHEWSLLRPTQDRHEGTWHLPSTALVDGRVYVVRGQAYDRAGHAATAITTELTVDLLAPVFSLLPEATTVASPTPALDLVFRAVDTACGLLRYEVQREIDGVTEGTVFVLGPEVTSWSEPDVASVSGHRVRYLVRAVDVSGKSTEAYTQALDVDFDLPTSVLEPLLDLVGRTVVDGLEIGPGLAGGTVLTHPPMHLPFRVDAYHAKPHVTVRMELWVDGADRTAEVIDGIYTLDAGSATRDVSHTIVVKAIASNGLSSESRRVLYFPDESVRRLAEETPAQWTLQTGSADANKHTALIGGAAGSRYVQLKSTTGPASWARWNEEAPSARLQVAQKVSLGWYNCGSPRAELLTATQQDVPRYSLVVLGCYSNNLWVERAGLPAVRLTGQTISSGRTYDVRVVQGVSTIDVYVDGVFLDSVAVPPATKGALAFRWSAANGVVLTVNDVYLRTRGADFYSLQSWQPVTNLVGWLTEGSGTVTQVTDETGIALRAAGTGTSFRAKSPAFKAAQFVRASAYVRLDGTGTATTVFGLLGTDNSVIAAARVADGRLEFRDGAGWTPAFDAAIAPGQWHRLDLELAGGRYVVTLDGPGTPAADFAVGSAARPQRAFVGEGTTPVLFDRSRVELGRGFDHAFTGPVASVPGWGVYETGGGAVGVDPAAAGLVGRGVATLAGTAAKGGLATAYVDVSPLGTRYTAELTYRVDGSAAPDHQALWAGFTAQGGAPKWALTVAPAGLSALSAGHSLFYTDEKGVTQPVGSGVFPNDAWGSVRVTVDVPAKTLTVWRNEQLIATVKDLHTSLSGVASLAMGDVWGGDLVRTGAGTLEVDDANLLKG